MRIWPHLMRNHICAYVTCAGKLSSLHSNTYLQRVRYLHSIHNYVKKKISISSAALKFTSPHTQTVSMATVVDSAEATSDDPSQEFSIVSEGRAEVIHPSSVFYNPVQEFNRDITIAAVSVFAEEHAHEVREKERKQELREKEKAIKLAADSDTGIHVQTDEGCTNNSNSRTIDKVENVDIGKLEPVSDKCDNGSMEVDNHEDPIKLEVGKVHEKGIYILEGLSASGLRSVRFGLEVPGVKKIVANDFSAAAVDVINKNIDKNNLTHLIEASHADVSMLMYQHKPYTERFDVVDLDPYGTAAPFLDGAVQAVRDGGLLCVTCTDAAILCGNRPEKCFTNYGAMSLRTKYCHEMALRIILQCIQSHANRHARYIVPLISLSVDFYLRIFVKVYTGAAKAKESPCNTGMVYQCVGCGMFAIQKLADMARDSQTNVNFRPAAGPPVSERCVHCGSRHQLGGPIYTGPLHDQAFIRAVLAWVGAAPAPLGTCERIEGVLSVAAEELDVPLYHMTDGLCSVVHCEPPPSLLIRSAILNAGYQVSFSHAAINSIKTDAPHDFIWDIMRTWVKDHPVHTRWLTDGSPTKAILDKEPTADISFTSHPGANPVSRASRLKRFQVNPTKNWGPKPRARKVGTDDTMEQRRLHNQGKRKKKNIDSDSEPHADMEAE